MLSSFHIDRFIANSDFQCASYIYSISKDPPALLLFIFSKSIYGLGPTELSWFFCLVQPNPVANPCVFLLFVYSIILQSFITLYNYECCVHTLPWNNNNPYYILLNNFKSLRKNCQSLKTKLHLLRSSVFIYKSFCGRNTVLLVIKRRLIITRRLIQFVFRQIKLVPDSNNFWPAVPELLTKSPCYLLSNL